MADKTMEIFRITGRVIALKTRDGLAEMRVEAWDKDLLFDDFVGKTDTDLEGHFQIEF